MIKTQFGSLIIATICMIGCAVLACTSTGNGNQNHNGATTEPPVVTITAPSSDREIPSGQTITMTYSISNSPTSAMAFYDIDADPTNDNEAVFANELNTGGAISTIDFNTDSLQEGTYYLGITASNSAGTTIEYASNSSGTPVAIQVTNAPVCTDDHDCDDGLFCNGEETCNTTTGNCVAGMAEICDDSDLCTADTCEEPKEGEEGAQCVNIPIECAEGEVCDSATSECSSASGFELTISQDDLTGTSGNDTFNAPLVFESVSGKNIASLQNTDHIDGQAGYDTLFADFVDGDVTIAPTLIGIEEIDICSFAFGSAILTFDTSNSTGIVTFKINTTCGGNVQIICSGEQAADCTENTGSDTTCTCASSGEGRTLPSCYTSSSSFTVTIIISPPSGTLAYGVEETLPSGWAASNVNESGEVASNGKVRWTFSDGNSRTLSYTIAPSVSSSDQQCFSGIMNFNGTTTQDVAGDTCISECP